MTQEETLDILPGEGEEKTVFSVRTRHECCECGDPAHKKHTYLLEGNARRNPESSAYGKDDISWCSDHEEFTCKTCKMPSVPGYSWCCTFSAVKHFAHMFLYWREVKQLDPAPEIFPGTRAALSRLSTQPPSGGAKP